MIGEDIEVRDGFIQSLESRFLFLAADARSTLRYSIALIRQSVSSFLF